MATENGREMAFKVGDPQNVGQSIISAGWVSTSFDLGTNMVETTMPDASDLSATPDETYVAGVKSHSFEGDGFMVSGADKTLFLAARQAGQPIAGVISVPGIGVFSNAVGWLIEKLTFTGGLEDPLKMSVSFKPAGKVTFVAA